MPLTDNSYPRIPVWRPLRANLLREGTF